MAFYVLMCREETTHSLTHSVLGWVTVMRRRRANHLGV